MEELARERVVTFAVSRGPTTLGKRLYPPYRERLLREDELVVVFVEAERLEGRTPPNDTPRLTVEPR